MVITPAEQHDDIATRLDIKSHMNKRGMWLVFLEPHLLPLCHHTPFVVVIGSLLWKRALAIGVGWAGRCQNSRDIDLGSFNLYLVNGGPQPVLGDVVGIRTRSAEGSGLRMRHHTLGSGTGGSSGGKNDALAASLGSARISRRYVSWVRGVGRQPRLPPPWYCALSSLRFLLLP